MKRISFSAKLPYKVLLFSKFFKKLLSKSVNFSQKYKILCFFYTLSAGS